MPVFRISNLSEHGVIRDLKPHRLPPNAFTDGDNVRFREGVVMPVGGYADLDPLGDEDMDALYWIQHYFTGSSDWWVLPGLESATEKVVK